MLCRISWQSFNNQDKELVQVMQSCILDIELYNVRSMTELFCAINSKMLPFGSLNPSDFIGKLYTELNHHLYVEVLRTSDRLECEENLRLRELNGIWEYNIHFIY